MFRRGWLGILAAASVLMSPAVAPANSAPMNERSFLVPSVPRIAPKRKGVRGGRGKRYRMNGKRECARRRRQIEAGQLREENGLWPKPARRDETSTEIKRRQG